MRFVNTSAVVVALTVAMTATPLHAAAAGPTPNWGQIGSTQTPSGRAFAAMSYDSVRARTVLFGGAPDTQTTLSDTWEWDGATWTQKTRAISPPGLVGAAMVFDSSLGHSVLFGGAPSSGPFFAGTWEWDGTAWTLRYLSASPQPRLWHAMAYDSSRNRVVLFGGTGQGGSSSTMGDTWEFDGSNWNQAAPNTSPSPRYGAAMAFDSVRNKIVLFGGRDPYGTRLGDTWEWDGTNWTQRSSSSAPSPRYRQSMAFDVQEGKTVLFGGDQVGPFGASVNDTWEWDGSQWTQIWPSAAPSPRAGQSTVYDSNRGRIVLFGGMTNDVPPFYGDTWELGAGIVTPSGNPNTTFSPSNVPFETVNVGGTSSLHNEFAINSGTGPLLISSIFATGDFSVSSTTCPIAPNALAAGSYCMVFVAFSPTAIGTRNGSLVLGDNGPNGGQSLVLQATGTGNPSVLTVSSATATFGASASISATLTANGAPVSGVVVKFALPNGVSATMQTDSQGSATWASASVIGISVGSYPGGIQAIFAGSQSLLATSASATLTVVSDTDLALTGMPSDISVNPSDSSGAVVSYTPPTAVDEAGDSSAATVNCSPASGSTFAIGMTAVTCTATDADDTPGTMTQTFNVTVLDTDLALAGAPANITVNATGPSGAVVTYASPTTVDEAGDTSGAAVSCTPASGSTFAIGTTTVTCTATDGDETGTVGQAFTVSVLDTDLAMTGVPGNVTSNATSSSGAIVSYASPAAIDETGDSSAATMNCTPASGSTFAIGTTTVTCAATDADDTPGNVSQAFTVTVLDTDLAFTGAPANITINAASPSGAAVTYTPPTAVDEAGDSPAATVRCTPASGATFAIGTTTVTCTAVDADDNPSTVNQTFPVTVLDTDLALTGVPAGITVNATTKSGAVATYSAVGALDEAGDGALATAVCTPASGSTFAVGTTTVTCTATSADDNPATVSAQFTVTVLVDLRLAVSISPTTATNGKVVTANLSLTNSGSVTRTVTLVTKFSFISSTGQTTTYASSRVTITLAAGKTAIRASTFRVSEDYPRGTYSFTATASDVTGSVSSGGTFKVI